MKKKLYLIGGTMGVGKTTVSRELQALLPSCVFLDGDWCWDAQPFCVTPETKQMVLENICFLLNRFLRCSAYENIVFCWVMHEQSILGAILGNLTLTDCEVKTVSLLCEPKTLQERLQKDICAGVRSADVLSRSLAHLPLYGKLNTVKIHTDGKTARQIAVEITL